MSSSSDDSRVPRPGYLNVPSPPGSKAGQNNNRVIPSEQLGAFKAWQPGAFNGPDRRSDERRVEERGTGDRRAAPAGPAAAGAASTAGGGRPGAGAAGPQPGAPNAAEWQARVTAARQAGYQDGYRDGLVALEGFKQSFAQQTTAQLGVLLQAFDEQLLALDVDLAQAVARTAVQLAAQVLRSEVRQRPELVADVARQAVNTVMHSARHVTVHLHPQDLPLVSAGAQEVLAARGARLLADSTLQRGGVLVKSDLGTVDARLETRWAEASGAFGFAAPPLLHDTETVLPAATTHNRPAAAAQHSPTADATPA